MPGEHKVDESAAQWLHDPSDTHHGEARKLVCAGEDVTLSAAHQRRFSPSVNHEGVHPLVSVRGVVLVEDGDAGGCFHQIQVRVCRPLVVAEDEVAHSGDLELRALVPPTVVEGPSEGKGCARGNQAHVVVRHDSERDHGVNAFGALEGHPLLPWRWRGVRRCRARRRWSSERRCARWWLSGARELLKRRLEGRVQGGRQGSPGSGRGSRDHRRGRLRRVDHVQLAAMEPGVARPEIAAPRWVVFERGRAGVTAAATVLRLTTWSRVQGGTFVHEPVFQNR